MKTKIMTFILMIMMVLSMASCGFIVEEESLEISSIETKLLEDGQTMVIITYKNDVQDPTIFYLPKGADGTVGVGIDKIEEAEADVEGNTAFEIVLTTGEIKKIEVPNGVSIVDTTTITKEEDGKHYLVIYYSNGTTDEVEIFAGPAGKDGFSIVDVKQGGIVTEGVYMGYEEVIFTFSDGTGENSIDKSVYVKPGVGISDIKGKVDYENNLYILNVYYTDGTEGTPIKLEIPHVVKWYQGGGEPNSANLGKNGDFYFDTANYIIYTKMSDKWEIVCELDVKGSTTVCKIELVLNDFNPEYPDDKKATLDANTQLHVPMNSNLYSVGSTLPTPTREGYKFLGWYTTSNPKDYIDSPFNNLTIVTGYTKLYAKWERLPISE